MLEVLLALGVVELPELELGFESPEGFAAGVDEVVFVSDLAAAL